MRTVRILFVSAVIFCLSNLVFAYTSSFTLNFTNPGDTSGWSDPVNGASTIVTGE